MGDDDEKGKWMGNVGGQKNVLSNPRRQHNLLSIRPGNTKRVIGHVPSPGETGPTDIDGGDDLENGVIDQVGGDDVRYGDAEDDAAVAGVGGEGQTGFGVDVDARVGLELSGCCWRMLGSC